MVPYFILIFDDSQVTQSQANPADRALWERTYATLAVADREGAILYLLNKFDLSVFNMNSLLFHQHP